MTCVFHHGLGDERHVLDIAHSARRTCAPRRPVHAAGIEFHHTLFIRQTTKTHAVILGIVFWTLHYSERSVECVSAAAEELVRVFELVVIIPGTNDDDAFHACLSVSRALSISL